MRQLAWIGLGTMGVPMVKNLSACGLPLNAYNRSPKQVDIGSARMSSSITETVAGADVVFLMLSDGHAVRDVLFESGGVAKQLPPGTTVVNMSTIGVDETKQIAKQLADMQIAYVDAPVSGSVQPAISGDLVILTGGVTAVVDTIKPLLVRIGKTIFHLGPIGSGATMKLLVNAYLGLTMQGVAECMAVADKSGLTASTFLEVLSKTGMWAPILSAKRNLWQEGEYPAAFALKHLTKDLGLATALSTQLSTPMPAIFATLGMMMSAQASGLAEQDMSAIAKHMADLAGLQPKNY